MGVFIDAGIVVSNRVSISVMMNQEFINSMCPVANYICRQDELRRE